MLAFLKRRWILLTCALVSLACIAIRLAWVRQHFMLGILRGNLLFIYGSDVPTDADLGDIGISASFEKPQIEGLPGFVATTYVTYCGLPLWLLLSTALGWIVIRELRWREKRAKAPQATP